MKANNWLKELPFLLIISIPWIVFAVLQDRLPAQIPSHYSIGPHGWVVDHTMAPLNNLIALTVCIIIVYGAMSLPALIRQYRPDGMMKWTYNFKLALILFIAAIPVYTMIAAVGVLSDLNAGNNSNLMMIIMLLIVNGFTHAMFASIKKGGKLPASETNFTIIRIGVHVVISIGPLAAILASKGWVMERLVPEVLLLFIAIIGNLTYNIKPNRMIGIRTPWTLRNEEVWRRTHHFGGILFFACGLTGFIISIFAPLEMLHYLLVGIMLSAGLVCVAYSFFIYRKVAH